MNKSQATPEHRKETFNRVRKNQDSILKKINGKVKVKKNCGKFLLYFYCCGLLVTSRLKHVLWPALISLSESGQS